MAFDSAKLPALPCLDSTRLHTVSADELRRQCTSLATERYRAPVRIALIQRSSFTEAQVVPEAPSHTHGGDDPPQLKALSTSVRAALESLWRKLKREETPSQPFSALDGPW